MDIIFNEKYLRTMYLTGQTDKKHRYQPQVVRKYIRVIDIMIDVSDVQELLRYNSLNYEKLKGDKAGLSSVRVNDQYRIEFEEQMREGETIATICRIIDLSNHYNNRRPMIQIQGIDPDMIANNLTPAYATHPGEVIKDEIEYRKISQRKLAKQMGISYKVLNDLLNGRRSMTTATAMMLEAALGVPADSLMRLQLKYNMQQAAHDKSFMERLDQIRKYAALL